MSTARASYVPPVFNTPVRWTLRVLSWLAFGLSAYLAWHAVTGSSVAACGLGDSNGCDVVLASSWSKWLGVPVAVLGLACYATLAGLSILLGLRDDAASRWIHTAFLMLAILAAGASAWFLGLQAFVIGSYCVFCIATDVCGLAIGIIAVGATIRWLVETSYIRRRPTAAGVMALRTTLPGSPRAMTASSTTSPRLPTPSMGIAVSGALSLLVALSAGQILKPSKTHTEGKVALDQSISLVGSDTKSATEDVNSAGTQPHVAMRVPSEDRVADATRLNGGGEASAEPNGSDDDTAISAPSDINGSDASELSADNGATSSGDVSTSAEASASEPAERERLVKFLDGKLTLDVYKHPLIGSPEAPHVMIEMVSYDCQHCRKMHRTIERGLERYGKQLAVIIMPIPLEKGCNKFVTTSTGSHRGACATARFAIGVATIRPSAFAGFHDWLMSGDEEKAPPIEKVLPKGYNTVDRTRLRTFIRGEEVNKQIAQYVDLFGSLQKSHGSKQFGSPVQILGDHVLSGTIEKEEDVYEAWEKHLGVEPK